MATTNNVDIVIDEKIRSYAKIYSSLLKDEYQRKRAYASITGLIGLVNLLVETGNEVQKSMTLFRNPVLNEQYEIADFYINNWHIDVRVIVDGDAFLVPKVQIDNELQPDYYAVIKLDKNISKAELLGFANTSVLEKQSFDSNYYSVALSTLISLDGFLAKISVPKELNFTEEEHETFMSSYLSLVDDELDAQTKNKLLRHLFDCPRCRVEFCCFTGFEMVNCNIVKYPEVIEDETLDVIGAQAVEDVKYQGKEETIYIGDDDQEEIENASQQTIEKEMTEEETKGETVSDILDELFDINEDFIEPSIVEEKPIEQTPSVISVSDDLEIIEEDDFEIIENDDEKVQEIEDLQIIETQDEVKEESNELEVIDENDEMDDEDSDGVILVEDEPEPFSQEELQIKEDEVVEIVEEIEPTVAEAIAENDESVQKVIVDYDENGEPIYSYVTNVPQETLDEEDGEIEDIEDDILDQEFETYPQEEIEDYTEINNGSQRPIEYVQNEEESIEVEEDDDDNIQELREGAIEALSKVRVDDEVDEVEDYDDEELGEDIEFEEYDETESNDENVEAQKDIELEDVNDDIIASDYDEEQEEDIDNTEDVEDNTNLDDVLDDDSEAADETDEEAEYEDDEEYEDDDENASNSSKIKSIIISLVVLLALIGCGAGAFFFLKKQSQNEQTPVSTENNIEVSSQVSQIDDMFEASQPSDEGGIDVASSENAPSIDIEMPSAENQAGVDLPLPPPQEVVAVQEVELPPPPPQNVEPTPVAEVSKVNPKDVSASIANAFSPNANVVTLRSVNWQCDSKLFADVTFKSYLQSLDNLVKLNLRKNILDVTENPTSNTVIVKMAVANDGNLKRIAVSESSGSKQVDDIVLQSINESFEGEKSPIYNDGELKADIYYLKLVIKL